MAAKKKTPAKKTTPKNNPNNQMAGYVLLGRITQSVASEIKSPAGYIYADRGNTHLNKHRPETNENGISFAKRVIEKFNQVRQGSGDSFLLVIYNEKISQVVAVQVAPLKKQILLRGKIRPYHAEKEPDRKIDTLGKIKKNSHNVGIMRDIVCFQLYFPKVL